MKIFNLLLNYGTTTELSDSLRQKIRLSNGVAIYFIFMVFVYIGISIVFMPQILPFVITSGILYAMVPFLNKSGYYHLSRFIAATNPAIVSFIIHISTIKADESPIAGNLVIQLSFILLPWILFDFNDKILLLFSFVVTVLCIVLVRPLNEWIEPDVINEISRSPLLENIFLITACTIVGVTLYIMQIFAGNSEKEKQTLIQQSTKINDDLKANEQKLSDYIKQIEVSRIEDKRREWASNGIAKFAEILRSNHEDVREIYDSIILNIVKYLGANQGGLFVVQGEDAKAYLELVACYAYDRKKYINKRIEIGEGLVGQCYLERDIILMTEVPDNYTTISSGLGDARPRCVLIVPLIVNEEIWGILEMASFKKFEMFEIEFLQKVGESIASTISSLKISEKTKALLTQSMQQTEEMRAQEEEMRQNMEELSATQEEMLRKEKQLNIVLEETKKKEEEMAQLAYKHKEEVDTILAKVELLELKLKRKDKKIEEIESLLEQAQHNNN